MNIYAFVVIEKITGESETVLGVYNDETVAYKKALENANKCSTKTYVYTFDMTTGKKVF